MAKTSIIQLFESNGYHAGLYAYDPEQMSEEQAINSIENALEAAFQQVEAGEGGDIQSVADETLENLDIDRIHAGTANTERL